MRIGKIVLAVLALAGLSSAMAAEPSADVVAQAAQNLGTSEVSYGTRAVDGAATPNPFGNVYAAAPGAAGGPTLELLNKTTQLYQPLCVNVPVQFATALNASGIVYSLSTDPTGVIAGWRIWKIDPATCAYSVLSAADPFPDGGQVAAAAFDPSGRLWMRGLNVLYQLNTTTGVVIQGPINLNTNYPSPAWGGDIAFDAQGRFYNMVNADLKIWNTVPTTSPAPPPNRTVNISAQIGDNCATITGGAFADLARVDLTTDGVAGCTTTPKSYAYDFNTNTLTFLQNIPGSRFGDVASFPAVSDLSLTKRLITTGVINPGQNVTWQLTVTNAGPQAVTNNVVTDYLPAQLRFLAGQSSPQCLGQTGYGAQVLCRFSLGAGASVTYTLVTQINPAWTGGQQTNYAEITQAGFDIDSVPGNNSGRPGSGVPHEDDDAAVNLVVTPIANLVATKTASASPVSQGAHFTYTINVHNNGPANATTVLVRDVIPVGLTLGAVSGTGWTCQTGGQVLGCARPTLANGADAPPITIAVTAVQPGHYRNVCVAEADQTDADGTPTCISDVDVDPVVNLLATKTVSASPVTQGDLFDWTITVHNPGPNPADNLNVTDGMPAGLTVTGITAPDWTCALPSSSIDCTLNAQLPVNATTGPITIHVRGDVAGSYQNLCVATADNSSGSGRSCRANVVVNPRPSQLVATKSVSVNPVLQGDTFSWSILVANNGGGDALNPVVTDSIPAGLAIQSVAGAGWTCTANGQDTSCTTPVVPANSTATPIIITVLATTPGDFTNVCVATPGSPDAGGAPICQAGVHVDPRLSQLVATKTVSANPVGQGGEFDWIINVANNGNGAATNVQVVDTMPAGLAVLTATGSGWTCDTIDQTVACSIPLIGAGSAAPAITIHVRADVAGDYTNLCVASTDSADAGGAPPCQAITHVDPRIDLVATKTVVGASTVGQGGTLTFAISVLNNGPSPATNVVVTDNVPAGLTPLTATGTGWSCSIAAQAVSCATPTLAVGATAPSITIATRADVVGQYTNACVASAAETDPDGTPTCHTDVGVTPVANITAVKSASTSSVVQGGTFDWFIDVHNAGPSNATNVTMTDSMPVGLVIQGFDATGWTCSTSGQDFSCSLPTLAAGADAPHIVIHTLAVQVGHYTNVCVANASENPGAGTPTCTADVIVIPQANLSAVKTVSTPTVGQGDQFDWSILVHNAGPSDATNVIVTDNMPAGLTVLTASGAGWTCQQTGQSISCGRAGLANGADAPPITIHVRADQSGTFQNVCVATAAEVDPDGTPTCLATVTVGAVANLSAIKTVSASQVNQGAQFDFGIVVHNNGPADATNVVVNDAVPTGLTPLAATGAGWACTLAGNAVSCARAALVNGADAPPIVIHTRADTAGHYTNVCVASSSQGDPDGTPTCRVDVTVGAEANLSAIKTVSSTHILVGNEFDFGIVVHNAGPSDATHVSVADDVPSAFTVLAAAGGGWACTTAGQHVACTRPSLANGADAPPIAIHVRATTSGQFTNICVATATETDPDGTPTCRVDVPVGGEANLTATKTVSANPVSQGSEFDWAIGVHNAGPSDATNVSVADDVPAGLVVLTATGAGWSCTIAGQHVACSLPTLANGSNAAPIVIHVRADQAGDFTNVCVATATETDPDGTPTCQASTHVDPQQYNVRIDVTDSRDPVSPSTAYSYTVRVTNNGEADVTQMHVVGGYTLPANVQSIDGGSFACDAGGCSLASLAHGASASYVVNVIAPDELEQDLAYHASVTVAETETSLADNEATQPTRMIGSTSVGETKPVPTLSTWSILLLALGLFGFVARHRAARR